MSTITGTGFSITTNSTEAGKEATTQALATIGKDPADLIFVFASSNYNHAELLQGVKEVAKTDKIVGCTTAGEFNENEEGKNSVSVMAIKSDTAIFNIMRSTNIKGNQKKIAVEDFKTYKQEIFDNRKNGYLRSTLIMLVDGLSGDGEEFVQSIYDQAGIFCQIVGGAAADDLKFKETLIFHNEEVLTNAAVFVKVFSKNKFGIGVRHGMKAATEEMKVTKAEGGLLMELDHKPAFEAYKKYGKTREIELTTENANSFMINNNLAIKSVGYMKVRAPLGVNPEGHITMATEIRKGAYVTIVKSDEESLINAAKEAAEEALNNSSGKPAGILVFDCICRKTMMQENFKKEIDKIRETIGNVPLAGFDTYGEIARFGGKFNGFHNSTAVVLVIPE